MITAANYTLPAIDTAQFLGIPCLLFRSSVREMLVY
jgi:hypothetical protein